MVYTCTFCGKIYQRKGFYDRHISTCELLHVSSKERRVIIEKQQDIPTADKMYEMIVVLADKCNRLERQMGEVNKWMSVKQKKIMVNEWINTSLPKPEQEYTTLFNAKSIEIDENTLHDIYSLGIIEYIVMIMKKRLYFGMDGEKRREEVPEKFDIETASSTMVTIHRQQRIFYIYEDGSWIKQNMPEFAGFCGDLFNRIMLVFNVWWKKQGEENPLEMFNEINITRQKIIYTPINEKNRFKTIGTIRNKMYEFCKISLPAFVKEEETSP